jgi:hypothetical protein
MDDAAKKKTAPRFPWTHAWDRVIVDAAIKPDAKNADITDALRAHLRGKSLDALANFVTASVVTKRLDRIRLTPSHHLYAMLHGVPRRRAATFQPKDVLEGLHS